MDLLLGKVSVVELKRRLHESIDILYGAANEAGPFRCQVSLRTEGQQSIGVIHRVHDVK